MPSKMNEADWEIALEVFRVCPPARGAKVRDDRLFLEVLHFFTVHNIIWRALPERFGKWNSVWKRFDRPGKAGVFVDFFAMLAGLSSVRFTHRKSIRTTVFHYRVATTRDEPNLGTTT
jgi:transposase